MKREVNEHRSTRTETHRETLTHIHIYTKLTNPTAGEVKFERSILQLRLYTGDSCDRLLKIQLIIHRIRPLIDGRKKEPFNRRFNRPTLTAC